MTDLGSTALTDAAKLPVALKPAAKTLSVARSSRPAPVSVAIAPETQKIPEFSATEKAIEKVKTKSENLLSQTDTKRNAKGDNTKSNVEVVAPVLDEPEFDGMEQVTTVSQLLDVRPSDWAFQALQTLVERYACIAGYPNQTFRGNQALTRSEFAAGLNACLEQINQRITSRNTNSIQRHDLESLKKLQEEFASELVNLKNRVNALEARTATLEKTQFSTTTRLYGQAIVSAQTSNAVEADLFPRDGISERRGKLNPTIAQNLQISLATSFRGNDLLLTTLQTGNLRSSAPVVFTNMGRLAYESEQDNRFAVSDLSYRFALGNRFGLIVGAAGVNPSNTFRGINPLEGSGEGALSLLGQRNPILSLGNGTGGIGFDWQISDRVSLQGVYSAELPNVAQDSNAGGLFGGRYATGAQLTIAPTPSLDLGLHYVFSRSPDGLLGTGVGDTQLLSPFAPTNSAFSTHAIGASIAWRINPQVTIGGWGGWTTSRAINLAGSVQTTNWMMFAAFPDLGRPGNLGGLLFGQPPKITSSTLPNPYNFPRFSETGGKGGQPDTALHLEAFYRARVTQYLDLTPGVIVIFNPNHNQVNNALVIGAVRATVRF